MPKGLQNPGASVRARLLSISRERNQPFDLLLTRYVLERFLYRLGSSKYRERFILKGALLLTKWFDDPLRATRDLDLLGTGDPDPVARPADPKDGTLNNSTVCCLAKHANGDFLIKMIFIFVSSLTHADSRSCDIAKFTAVSTH
jgi:hypothetical protein